MHIPSAQKVTLALLGLLGLAGCVAVSGVIPEANGNFSLTATDRQPHRSSLKLSTEVRERAATWCKTQGYEMIVVSETHSGNPLGNTARIVFRKKRVDAQHSWSTRPVAESRSRLLGSGLVVSPDGHVVTWLGLVEGMPDIKAYSPTTRNVHGATLVDSDSKSGLALLKLALWHSAGGASKTRTAISLGSPLAHEENVKALGFPLEGIVGQDSKITTTSVILQKSAAEATELRLSSPVSAGNLGCPVMLSSGAIIGIVATNLSPATSSQNNESHTGPTKVIDADKLRLFLKRNKLLLDINPEAAKTPIAPTVVQIISEK